MDFVVIADHSPQNCPSSNAKVRKQLSEGFPQLPNLAKRLGVEVTFVGIPMVDHKIFMVVKAQNFEAVRNLIVESAIMQTNTVHIYPTVSFEEAIKSVEKLPTIF